MYSGVRTLFGCAAERWPELIDELVAALPPRGDAIELVDLTNWAENRAACSAEALVMRRCRHDEALVRAAEDWLLERLNPSQDPVPRPSSGKPVTGSGVSGEKTIVGGPPDAARGLPVPYDPKASDDDVDPE